MRHVLVLVLVLVLMAPADPEEILAKNGVDPYTFVRFLLMMAKAMVPIWLISWVILFPIDAVNSTVDGKSGLDKYTFGNVASNKQSRYWAHLILDYIFICEPTPELRFGTTCRDSRRGWEVRLELTPT
jgi:hypothetical protein